MKKIFHSPLLFPILLTIILTIVCLTNYTPSTYLTGWDNLMPELNIWMNLKRSLFAVWQEYQGLGLVGGMGHATDLIRQLIILPFTLILPHSLIRYLWHFVMLFLGTFGIYFGIKKTFKFGPHIAFLSSLFYLLNFGTIQYFWAPLETFSTFWGFFPWLIFTLWNYLDQKTSLKKLFIVNLLAIPSFYVQTLFIVYLICVFIILFSHFIILKKFSHLKFYSSIALLLFFINSFWLLPQIYFLKTNLGSTVNGIGNFMSNDDSFARNQARGYLNDFAILCGYYIDFPDTEGLFMAPWVTYFANQYTLVCGYILSVFVFIGFIYLLSQPQKLNFIKLSLLLIFSLISLVLLSATPPFAQINSILRVSGLINQIFRAPFTKFIVPAVFSFSLLSAFGLNAIIKLLTQIKYSPQFFVPLLFTSYCLLITIFSFPAFQGNFISPKLRRQIPTDYFEMFKYFKTKSPVARIANLPSGSFWGWTNYRWGYRGSGFIWYGMEQPILDRAFDTWNLKNEQYYWELDFALQKKDPYLLSRILKKYSIEYLIVDKNIFFPDEFIYSKINISLDNLLAQTPNLSLNKRIGQISIYKTSAPTQSYLLANPISTPNTNFFYEDSIFEQHQDYISSSDGQNLRYPFLNLFGNRLQSEFPYHIKIKLDNIIITGKSDYSTISIPVDNSINQTKNISLSINPPDSSIILSNRHNYQLLAYNFPTASLGKSYLVKVDYKHLLGLPLTLSINSDNLQHKYLSTRLDKSPNTTTAWFVLPSHETSDFNQGVTVLFNNNSLNNSQTINQIFDVNLYAIPFYDLIQQSEPISKTISNRTYTTSLNHLFYYKIPLTTYLPAGRHGQLPITSYLVLPQSYSAGWLAFYFDNYKIKFLSNHVLVNNWANGWKIPSELSRHSAIAPSVYIFFWPQLLEFAGLLLIPISFLWIVLKKSKDNQESET